ncbi:DUF4158 domain-containing protein [Pseudarthrobacter sp. P1]|uniref:DUF4158 domain-containing protein n=1 Tax=Pseudarthrobacter sp. P1 TaxID=3418418 RepID=UPI003CF4DAE4
MAPATGTNPTQYWGTRPVQPLAPVARYGRFVDMPSQADLERFFFLDVADKAFIQDRGGDHNRLGLVLQATTVRSRAVSIFLPERIVCENAIRTRAPPEHHNTAPTACRCQGSIVPVPGRLGSGQCVHQGGDIGIQPLLHRSRRQLCPP